MVTTTDIGDIVMIFSTLNQSYLTLFYNQSTLLILLNQKGSK